MIICKYHYGYKWFSFFHRVIILISESLQIYMINWVANPFVLMYCCSLFKEYFISAIIVGSCHIPLSHPLGNIMIFQWRHEILKNISLMSLRLTNLFEPWTISGLSIIFKSLLQGINILHAWEHMVTIHFIVLLFNKYGCNTCCKRGIFCVYWNIWM